MIGLPSALFYGTGIPAALLIINKKKPAERKGKVLFINSELEYQEGKNQNKLRDEDIQHILDVYDAYEDEKRYSKVVSMDEIRENDYNLNIRRYADTSPPPEQFDVKAILRGGFQSQRLKTTIFKRPWMVWMCPVCLFAETMSITTFKPEIETKEQIRDHLGDADQSVITQFERWWDKYRVSLHEIDAQVKESEEVMWGYLKELGYE